MTDSVQEKHHPGLNQTFGNKERKKKISGRHNQIYVIISGLNVRREEDSKVSRVKTLK